MTGIKQGLRAVFRFVRTYRLFTLAALGLVVAGVLTLLHHADIAHWVLLVISVIALIPLVIQMVRDLRSGRYGVDILAALAIGTSLVLQQDWAAIVIVIMWTGGKSLEDFATARARSELKDLLKRAPQHAHVLRKGKPLDVLASEVREGDTITIRPGETVPVDAIILNGLSNFDESSLTGESVPAAKTSGDTILSGSVNADGLITAKATATAADSQYQQIIRLVNAASEHPAPFARLADRYSIPFTVVALTIAGIAWIISGEPIRFLEVIVVATPCPLILATPIALIAGMSRAARDGIIIKTGTALEQIAEAKTFAFDKTGTLTHGTPTLDEVVAFHPYTKQNVLAWAAALEQASNHVLAAAIRAGAQAQGLKLPKTKHIRELAGRGLEAHAQGKDVLVGRFSFMHERGVTLPTGFDTKKLAQTVTFVTIDGALAGYLTFHDAIRSETKATLRNLAALGVNNTLMVTGDNLATAQAIAQNLGITEVTAEALPGDKVHIIEGLTARPVAFVGDGVNDAPVLMAADIGIALGARGSTAASESADVVIMKDDLAYVARAVALSKRAFRIATESIAVGIGLSVLLMLVFATGKFSPITGAVTQEFVDVIVILNALRAHSPGKSLAKL